MFRKRAEEKRTGFTVIEGSTHRVSTTDCSGQDEGQSLSLSLSPGGDANHVEAAVRLASIIDFFYVELTGLVGAAHHGSGRGRH